MPFGRRGGDDWDLSEDLDDLDDDVDAADWDDTWDDADGEFEEVRESSVWRRVLTVVAVLVAVAVLAALAGFAWWQRQLDPSGPPGKTIEITVPKGFTTTDIAALLEDEGVIPNSTVFRYYASWNDKGPFDAGEYELRRNSSVTGVISVLEKGPRPPEYSEVLFKEGWWQKQIVAEMRRAFPDMDPAEIDAALVTVDPQIRPDGVTSLEGLLFPAKYRVEEGDEADELALVDQLVNQFTTETAALGYDKATELTGLSPYEVVIIASLIESEAKRPEERPMVARVIYNRLAQGTPLGIDAAVIYGLGEHTDTLLQSQLDDATNPYNTRIHTGLPPTPISNPGRASLDAALHPAPGDWLYYVLKDAEGHHLFTADYNEFLRQKEASAAAGLL